MYTWYKLKKIVYTSIKQCIKQMVWICVLYITYLTYLNNYFYPTTVILQFVSYIFKVRNKMHFCLCKTLYLHYWLF